MNDNCNYNELPFKKIKFHGAGQPEIILERALRTIGDKEFVTWMACTCSNLPYPPLEEHFKNIEVMQWLKISNFIGLDLDATRKGYSQYLHIKLGLFDKIATGSYVLPRNKKYKAIKRSYDACKSENKKNEKELYGKMLYLIMRWRQLKSKVSFMPRFVSNSINSVLTLWLARMAYNRLIALK